VLFLIFFGPVSFLLKLPLCERGAPTGPMKVAAIKHGVWIKDRPQKSPAKMPVVKTG